MKFLEFMDKLIPYDTFLNDLAARIVKMLENDRDDPRIHKPKDGLQDVWTAQRGTMEKTGACRALQAARTCRVQDCRPAPVATNRAGLF